MARHFFCFGWNHRSAGVAVREQLALSAESQEKLMVKLLSEGFQEIAVLNTCNRLELYGVSDSIPRGETTVEQLGEVCGVKGIDPGRFYLFQDKEAVRHLFRVASSLDSQIVGETHILGQVKNCYQKSYSLGASGKLLNMFFQRSFQVAKKVRNETDITALPVSVGSCAVALVERIYGLSGCSILIVGAGEIAQNCAKHFAKHNVPLTFCNRTFEKAQALAKEHSGNAAEFRDWPAKLVQLSLVVFAAQVEQPLLTESVAAELMKQRKNEPLLLLDLGMPRNVEPAVGDLDSVFLYDIDAVQGIVDAHYTIRLREAEKAEKIISQASDYTWARLNGDRNRKGAKVFTAKTLRR